MSTLTYSEIRETATPGLRVRRSFRRVATLAASVPEDLVEALWHEPEALIKRGDPLRKSGARQTVRLRWQGASFVLKHYVEPTWRHALKQTVQSSRAWCTWRTSHDLANAGILTPRPVACVENRWGPLRRDSFLMYPYVEGETLWNCFREQPEPAERLERLLGQCAALWHRLAELRASVADANAGNFIVGPGSRVWIIDLDKARIHRIDRLAARRRRRAWRQLERSLAKAVALR